jgi:hypothetical protein
VFHFTPIARGPALEAAPRFYNGGDPTMRAIWINAVTNLVADLPDLLGGFTGAALTHRH